MRNARFFMYGGLGLLFGIADWYFIKLIHWLYLSVFQRHIVFDLLGGLLHWGIWLMPALYVATREYRYSRQLRLTSAAVSTTWMAGIIGYHVYFAFLLTFIGLPQLEDFQVWHASTAGWWSQWSTLIDSLIIHQIIEWTPLALIGGALVGWASGSYFRRRERRLSPTTT